jgi:hypothetical protein
VATPLQTWVEESARLTKPDRIIYCDGSDAENQAILAKMLSSEETSALNEKTYPNCYLHLSSPNDVARTEHLGQVKRRLARFAVPAAAAAGVALFTDGQPAGTVINATPSPNGGWELLAVVQIEAAQANYAGAPLRLGAEGPELRPLPLPYPLPAALAQRSSDGG